MCLCVQVLFLCNSAQLLALKVTAAAASRGSTAHHIRSLGSPPRGAQPEACRKLRSRFAPVSYPPYWGVGGPVPNPKSLPPVFQRNEQMEPRSSGLEPQPCNTQGFSSTAYSRRLGCVAFMKGGLAQHIARPLTGTIFTTALGIATQKPCCFLSFFAFARLSKTGSKVKQTSHG